MKKVLIAIALILMIFAAGCIDNYGGNFGAGKSCIQVITPAKNPATGECREFATPCDVPEGWIKGCSGDITTPKLPNEGNKNACIQVITPARDPKTGDCIDFPTPCDVPQDWNTVESC